MAAPERCGAAVHRPAHAAFSGFAALNGEEAGGERVRYYALIDLYCGHLICEAVLAALVARRREGKPQYIEMTMLGGATSALMTRLASRSRGCPAPPSSGASLRRTDCTRLPMARLLSPLKMIADSNRCAICSAARNRRRMRALRCRQHGSSMLRR